MDSWGAGSIPGSSASSRVHPRESSSRGTGHGPSPPKAAPATPRSSILELTGDSFRLLGRAVGMGTIPASPCAQPHREGSSWGMKELLLERARVERGWAGERQEWCVSMERGCTGTLLAAGPGKEHGNVARPLPAPGSLAGMNSGEQKIRRGFGSSG